MSSGSIDLGASSTIISGGGGGTVIQVSAGAGLTGGPINTSGTLSVASVSLVNQVVGTLPGANGGSGTQRTYFDPALDSGITGSIVSRAFWWRDGNNLNVEGTITFQGAGAGTANEAITIGLPVISSTQLLINTTQLSNGTCSTNQGATQLGYAHYFISGSGWKFLYPVFNTTGAVKFVENNQALSTGQLNAGDGIKYFITAPIIGW